MGKVSEKIAAVFKRRSRQYDLEDWIKRQQARGYEGALQIVDSTPVAPPIGYQKRDSIFDQMRAMVQAELTKQRTSEEQETFEEADDFDIPEDEFYDPKSPYENDFDPPLRELLTAGLAEVKKKKGVNPAPAAPADAPKPGSEPDRPEGPSSGRSSEKSPEKPS